MKTAVVWLNLFFITCVPSDFLPPCLSDFIKPTNNWNTSNQPVILAMISIDSSNTVSPSIAFSPPQIKSGAVFFFTVNLLGCHVLFVFGLCCAEEFIFFMVYSEMVLFLLVSLTAFIWKMVIYNWSSSVLFNALILQNNSNLFYFLFLVIVDYIRVDSVTQCSCDVVVVITILQ